LVDTDFFFGPDGVPAIPEYESEFPDEFEPALYYIWASSDLDEAIQSSSADIISALTDEDYEGLYPIDLAYAQKKHSVLKLRV
jgi:hypothetical protein